MHSWTMNWAEELEASELGKQTLYLIMQSYAGQPFKLEQLEKLARDGISGAELRIGVLSLVRTGIVCVVKKTWGERLYFISGRLFPKLQASLLGPINKREEAVDLVSLNREGRAGIEVDLFRMLVWVGHNGLQLTAKGTIHQKTITRLGGLIQLAEDDFKHIPLHYLHKDVYPANIAVVLDLLLALGLIEKIDSWIINEPAADAWLRLTPTAMRLAVYKEILARYIPADPSLQQYAYALSMDYVQEGNWYFLDEIVRWLQRYRMLTVPLSELQITFMHGWLEMLCGLGFVDLGFGKEGEAAFRWRSRPKLQEQTCIAESDEKDTRPFQADFEGRFYVQPDFEIFVPSDVSYLLRWELELCTLGVTYDAMSVYKLSRESAAIALEQGRTPSDLEVFLDKWAASGIPDNVRNALRQWGSELGRTSLEERVLLRCSDEEAAEMISRYEGGQSRLERIGPLDFIVNQKDLKEIHKVLNHLNLTPRKSFQPKSAMIYPRLDPDLPITGESSWKEAVEMDQGHLSPSEPQGLIFNGAAVHIYKRDESRVALADLFPGIDEIPQAWCKELRSYHTSTAKALIQQALAWRTKIRLEMEGKVTEVLPLGLLSGNSWKVEALMLPSLQVQELSCSEWDTLQLLLPEDSCIQG
ncbi:helicase-associated domain-containing protein [Paenibacillus sp. SN-8-1]|uniref:helicase-associated domain-containing protein n=1 Tax=Paenibacillus sp. SN-8-1 TaxID=3435409 RepID=UPI003D9A221D